MMRYLRLYGYFLEFSFSRAMQFRFDFWFRILMDAVYYVVIIATYRTFYIHTATMGGFTLDQAMVFIGATVLIDAIAMTLYANGLWWIPTFVNKGDLDYYLVRPVSSLFFIAFREFAAASCLNVLIAGGILAWALAVYPDPISAWKIVYGCILILNGAFLFFILRVLMISPTFWTASTDGLQHIFFYLREAMERPDGVYTGWVRRLFVSIMPFALMASFPAHVFFEDFNPMRLLHITAVTIGLFMLMLWVWGRGLRQYSSASS